LRRVARACGETGRVRALLRCVSPHKLSDTGEIRDSARPCAIYLARRVPENLQACRRASRATHDALLISLAEQALLKWIASSCVRIASRRVSGARREEGRRMKDPHEPPPLDGSHKPTILYLDDDADCLEVFLEMFQGDYRVLTAHTFAEARRALASARFDIVISDQSMPEGDGIGFLREVAAAQPASFRILLTGCTNVGAHLREMAAGVFQLFATKPWSEKSMREKLERAQALREPPAR
jgi:CheY-like chemotaxis protein